VKTPARLALACLLPLAALAADRPNVKVGLWEITHESSNSGPAAAAPAMPQLSDDMLARLPPEARARLQAVQAGRAGGGKLVMQQCITEHDLDHPFEHTDPRGGRCTNEVVSRTATSAEVNVSCKSEQMSAETHGTLKWQVDSPTAMHGTIDTTTQVGARSLEHHSQISGRWLGADCGDVKPDSPKIVH